MDSNFWHSRWSEGKIGFHEGKPNEHLVKHLAVLGTKARVFVPLCGKSEDLAFLAAQGHELIGVELVESAVQAFFDEHGVKPTVSKHGPFTQYTAQNITLLAGDFFACTPALLGRVDALYDRAAVIALPEQMRGGYVKHLRTLMPVGARGLIITVEYPQDKMEGPPFSVPEAELRAHYAGLTLERVGEVKAEGPRFTPINAVEKSFLIRF
jgi:thiopurine S-methyltransferase